MEAVTAPLPEHYRLIADFLYKRTGIRLGHNKLTLVESRLLRRRASLGIKDWKGYAEYLKSNIEQESLILIEALTTHKTDWFRENEHYAYLEQYIKSQSSSSNFMIWSAACSTGEEAYTAALTLLKLGRQPESFRILGTDISQDVVDKANQAEYPAELMKGPLQGFDSYFRMDRENQRIRVAPEIRRVVKFRKANLMNPALPPSLKFDVIFLRNVLIYFDQESSHVVIDRLRQHLKPGGILFLGLSEALRFTEPALKNLGQSVFLHEPAQAA